MKTRQLIRAGVADRLLSCLSCKVANKTKQWFALLCRCLLHCSRTCCSPLGCTAVSASAISYATPVMRSQIGVLPLKFCYRYVDSVCVSFLCLTSCLRCKLRLVVLQRNSVRSNIVLRNSCIYLEI